MFDSDLAMLYEVETKVLNQAVKRNIERFPKDFMFQLTEQEWEDFKVRLQIVTSPKGGGRQYLPYVFTEQGVSMLSSVLKSKKAIQINVQIMRTFVAMRQWAIENKDMAQRLAEIEHYFIEHCRDNEHDIRKLYEAIELLMDRTKPTKIGFIKDSD
jgi:phage regulator Rha-like protein